MSDTQAQEAARLAEWLEADACDLQTPREAAALLRSQAARIAELEREIARMREPLTTEHRAAVGVCMTVGHVSVATVQRNLRIGWNRARDILVDLVQRGVLDGLPLSAEFDGITKTGGGV